MSKQLTKRQSEILEYIKVFRQLNNYSPSLEEIKKQFKLSATSTVHEHISNLVKKGYLEKTDHSARQLVPSTIEKQKNERILEIFYNLTFNGRLIKKKSPRTITLDLNDRQNYVFCVKVTTNLKSKFGLEKGDLLLITSPGENQKGLIIVKSSSSTKLKKSNDLQPKDEVIGEVRKLVRNL